MQGWKPAAGGGLQHSDA